MGLLDRLRAYGRQDLTRLHLPAHGGGAGNPSLGVLGPYVRWDATEVPGLDEWAAPSGVILQAQARAASAYGVDEAFFLVGGSSQGIATALLACLDSGDRLLLHRGVHRSVLQGLVLTGAIPVFVEDHWDPCFGISWPDTGALARGLWEERPRAILVTYPTYAGLAPDLGRIVREARAVGALVIVDSAHGAHFGRGGLPPLASSFAPDLVVYGMHKSGGSLTPSALLGVIGDRVDRERLDRARRLLGTSSPSYPLMASLELAVDNLEEQGEDLVRRTRETMEALRGPGVFLPPEGLPRDGTRKVVGPVLQGGDAARVMDTLGVVPEYVSRHHALLYAPLGLASLPGRFVEAVQGAPAPSRRVARPPALERAITPREAFFLASERVPLAEAAGRVGADLLAPAPPGIPLAWPGERLNSEVVRHLLSERGDHQAVLGLDRHGAIRVVS